MDTMMKLGAESPVVLFNKNTCCISYSIETLIRGFGANPTIYKLDELPNGKTIERALLQMRFKPSTPTTFIGKELVGGSNEVISLNIRGKLKELLIKANARWIWNSIRGQSISSHNSQELEDERIPINNQDLVDPSVTLRTEHEEESERDKQSSGNKLPPKQPNKEQGKGISDKKREREPESEHPKEEAQLSLKPARRNHQQRRVFDEGYDRSRSQGT
ncbi:hypothetical protein RND71_025575 [Anisodus tanguticus]|uniref:Glutaredoxin domain-containing protein n=1 Tax=Anisodus tanguticus TaxID=243964 RepID=A0AAE1VCS7_9SOLA|nr:hypothetical protein RND71_025575 [Anisodus tanguticus]